MRCAVSEKRKHFACVKRGKRCCGTYSRCCHESGCHSPHYSCTSPMDYNSHHSLHLRHTHSCKTGANVSVPMCLGPPSRGQKAPLRIHKSCLLHMSSRTQHTGGIHKAVSCICNSNIQGCSTLGDPHPVLTVPSFPPPLTTENSLKNPCNVICTNK